jgi:hypothetical protein
MKNPIKYIAFILLCASHSLTQAQAFDQNNIMMSLGLGLASYPTTAISPAPEKYPMLHARPVISSVRPQLQFRTQFGVQRYISIGVMTTYDRGLNLYNPVTKKRYDEVNIRLATTADFHFYQLIADRMCNSGKLHADRWDIYAGFTLGTDLRIDQTAGVRPVYQNKLYMGLHIGVRYRINQHWGIYAEAGVAGRQPSVGAGIIYYFGGPKKSKRVLRDF